MNLSIRRRIRLDRGRRVRIWVRLLVFGTVAACLAGCGPGSSKAAPNTPLATTATSSANPSPSGVSAGGAATALDAYRGMWKAYIEALRIPDPQHPDLARYAEGNALKVFVNGLTSAQRDGLVGKGDVVLHPRVTTIHPNASPPRVDIEDCVGTSQSQLVKRDGSPYQDTAGGRRLAKATATRTSEGMWKVTGFALFGVGTC